MKKQNLTIQLTTKEHFNKYKDLLKGVTTADKLRLVRGLYCCEDELQELYNNDVHLNNVNMKEIDNRFHDVMHLIADKIRRVNEKDGKTYLYLSLAESCSLIKHILIYTILEIQPFFEEDIKNYKELYQEWRSQDDAKKYGVRGLGLTKWMILNKSKWVTK